MKQKFYVFIIAVFLLNEGILAQIKSQKVSITWGEEIIASRKATLDGILGFDQTGIYCTRREAGGMFSRSSTYTVEHYDNNMKQTKSVELKLKEGNKDKELEQIIYIKNKIYLFSSFRDKSEKMNFLYMQTLDKNNLTPNNDITEVAEIDYEDFSRYNSGYYGIKISRDSSKILVYNNLPYDKGENEKLSFNVYDSEMKLLWMKNITLPYKDELFDIERYRVDNSGNVYVLGLVYKEKKREKRHGEPNYSYTILCYSKDTNNVVEYPVNLQGKFLTDMQIEINSKNDIICAGFYSDEGTYSIKGSFFVSFDTKTKTIKAKSFKEFAIDVMMEDLNEKKQEKLQKKIDKGKNIELYEYDLDDIILRDDGGAILVGEQYYVKTLTYTSPDANGTVTTTTHYYYYYNDIIVINVNPDGNIDWVTTVPKYQVTVDDGGFYLSYAKFIKDDKIYFVFNDNPKNLFLQKGEKKYPFRGGKESLVVLVEVDGSGNIKKEALFNNADEEIIVRPKVCEQISKDKMIIFGQKGKTQRFAKFAFK